MSCTPRLIFDGTEVFTPERPKEEVQEKSQDQTLDINFQSKPYELNQYNPYTTRNSVNAKPVF
jgi:hypothetical protein